MRGSRRIHHQRAGGRRHRRSSDWLSVRKHDYRHRRRHSEIAVISLRHRRPTPSNRRKQVWRRHPRTRSPQIPYSNRRAHVRSKNPHRLALYLEKLEMQVKGRDMINGLPRVTVTSDDVTDGSALRIVEKIKGSCAPAAGLSADVMEKNGAVRRLVSIKKSRPIIRRRHRSRRS